MEAVKKKDVETLTQLLQKGVSPNFHDSEVCVLMCCEKEKGFEEEEEVGVRERERVGERDLRIYPSLLLYCQHSFQDEVSGCGNHIVNTEAFV